MKTKTKDFLTSVRVDVETLMRIDRIAQEEERPRSQVIRRLIEDSLKRREE